jgi:hypothetical protein
MLMLLLLCSQMTHEHALVLSNETYAMWEIMTKDGENQLAK